MVTYTYRNSWTETEHSVQLASLALALILARIDALLDLLGFFPVQITDGDKRYGPVEILHLLKEGAA